MKDQGFSVIDFHAHFPFGRWSVSPKPQIQEYGRERTRRMNLEWDFPNREEYSGQSAEELADRWAEEVEKYGLERIVFVTGGGNDVLARVVARHPDKFSGMAHHDPADPKALDLLRQAVEEYGLIGYKIIGPRMRLSFDDPSLTSLWDYVASRELPVLIHFGILGHAGGIVSGPNISPLAIANLSRNYPEIPFVIPHFGCGYFQELLHLCWSCPNVYADTSGSNQWMRWMPYPLDVESALRKAYETIGPRRIIFGTDSSWFPRGFAHRYLQDQVRAGRYMNMKDEDLADVFGGNAARLLKLR